MGISNYIKMIGALAIAIFFILGGLSRVYSAPGDPDISFGNNGIATAVVSEDTNTGVSVAIQDDGKIVEAGYTNTDNSWHTDFLVVRYDSDGNLDTSFGSNGVVITDLGGNTDKCDSMAIQPDGKIILAGWTDYLGTDNYFAVVRYNTDGSLDTSFDSNGIVTTSVGSADGQAHSVGIQGDGKIVVAGTADNGSNDDFAVVRYNSDGSLDTSFSGDGKVMTPIGSSNDDGRSRTLAIQSDGKIIVTGFSKNSSNSSDVAVVRYDTDGSLDTSFDSDGIVTTDVENGADYGRSVAIQPDGKIVVAGVSSDTSYCDDFIVLRYNTDGSPDTTFNSNGIVKTDLGGEFDGANSLAIQSNGKIVATGEVDNVSGTEMDFALVRYTASGSLDTSFGISGIVITDIFGAMDSCYSVAIQSDGKIIAAGYFFRTGEPNGLALIRYHSGSQSIVPSIIYPLVMGQ